MKTDFDLIVVGGGNAGLAAGAAATPRIKRLRWRCMIR